MAFTWSDSRPSDFNNSLVVFANSSPSLLSKVASSSISIGSELDRPLIFAFTSFGSLSDFVPNNSIFLSVNAAATASTASALVPDISPI